MAPTPNERAPLRTRLFYQIAFRQLVMTGLFLILEIAIVTVMYLGEPDSLIDDLVSIEASRIAHGVEQSLSGDNKSTPGLGKTRAFAVYDESGTPLLSRTSEDTMLPALSLPNQSSLTKRLINGQHFEVSGLRRVDIANHSYWVALNIVGDGLDSLWPALWSELKDHAILPLIPLSAMLLLFNVAVIRRMLAPLEQAVDGVKGLDPAAMGRRLDLPDSPFEVRILVCAINDALQKLEGTMQTLRDFTADAAHELRTPLAAMTLTVDRLPPSPEKDRLRQDTTSMSRLIAQLLDLARADALRSLPPSRVDLNDLAESVAADLAPLALRAGRQLSFRHHGHPQAAGNADALKRAVRNIVENALRHTAPGTEVSIISGPGPQIRIGDHGPGIPPELRNAVFERFWRSDGQGSGAGLGLAIVRAIMDASGGKVSIHTAEGGGTLVQLDFRDASLDA